MFAVLKTGGKQYRVQSGDVLKVEKLAAAAGETVQFNDVLMVGATVGTPLVDGAGVQAEVIDQIKGEKVINFVRRRRKHSSKRQGPPPEPDAPEGHHDPREGGGEVGCQGRDGGGVGRCRRRGARSRAWKESGPEEGQGRAKGRGTGP